MYLVGGGLRVRRSRTYTDTGIGAWILRRMARREMKSLSVMLRSEPREWTEADAKRQIEGVW